VSFGGTFSLQDGDNENDFDKVTHICMDRPVAPSSVIKGKEYISPQYIIDCLNNLFLLPTRPYMPGQPAPPHLSPFVDNQQEGYMPDRQREINTLAGVATAHESSSSDSEEEQPAKPNRAKDSDDEDIQSDSESDDEDEAESSEEAPQ